MMTTPGDEAEPQEPQIPTDTTTAAPEPDDASAAPAFDGKAALRAKQIAAISIVCYILFDVLLPLVKVPRHHARTLAELYARLFLIDLAPTGVFMLPQVWLARSLVGLRWNVKMATAVVVASTALWFVTLDLAHPWRNLPLLLNGVIVISRTMLFGMFLTVGLTALGTLLSRIIREPNVLMPVALIAMPIDYVGAMTNVGFTNTVVKHAPTVVQNVSVPVPHMGGLHPLALIGPGDALFMAMFFTVVQRLNLNMRGTFWWMTSLLALAMFIVLLTGLPIAALVPMGISILIANWRYFHLKRDEVFAVIYAGLIIFAIVGIFYYVSHRMMTH